MPAAVRSWPLPRWLTERASRRRCAQGVALAGLCLLAWSPPSTPPTEGATCRGSLCPDVSRVKLGGAMGALLMRPPRHETPAPSPPPLRRLRMTEVSRRDHIDVAPFDHAGKPRLDAFAEVAWLFRSAGGVETEIDARLVTLLLAIAEQVPGEELVLVSGHRQAGRGTSKGSYHVKGMAADIIVPGKRPREVRELALGLGATGVGLYGAFVHIDVRDRPYRWVGR